MTRKKKKSASRIKKGAVKTNKASKSKDLITRIAQDIERVAALFNIPAYALTKAKYFSEANFSEWDIRKFGGFILIRNTFFEKEEERDESVIYDTSQLRREYRKLRRELGDLSNFHEKLEQVIQNLPKLKLKPYKAKINTKHNDRTLNLVLSDLHLGSDLIEDVHTKKFGAIEESRVLAAIVKNVCDYKKDHRDQTELVVNILGDVIENNLHGVGSADKLHVQTCRAMWLLSQAIGRFSENFKKITVNYAVGNHGRDIAIHSKRATDIKYNSLETTIYYGVKLACSNLSNVKFNQPLTPWVSYTTQGHKIYATHGDTHLNPGNVGSKIDTKSLENQINKINASLKNNQEYRVFVVGHVHQALVMQLTNGAYLVVNGALVPPNGFAQTLNIMESQLIQVMWESTVKQPVGDFRFINVTNEGSNSKLDEIIIPFKGIDT